MINIWKIKPEIYFICVWNKTTKNKKIFLDRYTWIKEKVENLKF